MMSSIHTGETETPSIHARARRKAHPGPREYVRVAVALAIVTGLEVALFYIEALPDAAVVTALLILMVIKFSLVALWFMHLRFDSVIFMRLFTAGLAVAVTIFGIVLLTFGIFLGD
jgi:cytochrome c oxidase subunit 4